jgi:SAM-dependent methyltransferase
VLCNYMSDLYRASNGSTSNWGCLICGERRLVPRDEMSAAGLRKLWSALGKEISDKAWTPLSQERSIVLHSCSACGFRFFDPNLAGNEHFYLELGGAGCYYSENRPEFARTVAFAVSNGLKRVLDVGCGDGAFLDLARMACMETTGLELNQSAASRAQSKGHQIHRKLLDQVTLEMASGGYDLITLFQVLEHVRNPLQTVKEARALLKPGGVIAVAVPNEEGIYRVLPMDPYQWPPHHISRWRLRDLRVLAAKCELEVLALGGDVLLGSTLETFWIQRRRLARVLSGRDNAGSSAFPRAISQIYRKLGLKWLMPKWGNSIYAYFRSTD